jgi:hypothetical protein
MKALIQKDLRENVKVAWIGLLIFSLILLFSYENNIGWQRDALMGGLGNVPDQGLQPLLSPSLHAIAAWFCALFGVSLGWLQARNEAHPDLWAFLVQRPVTRTEIFRAKTAAGLCLYFFGAGLPLIVFLVVVVWPGHIAAPFEWAMALPLFSIFLTGPAYYFAGMSAGLRRARWYASRSLGLALAIPASLGVFNLNGFWQALIVTAIAVVILAAAVWGCYQSGGHYRGQPAAGRLGLIAAMAAGCGVVLYVGVGLVYAFVVRPLSSHAYVDNGNYAMAQDGVLYKTKMLDAEHVEIVDLDGHPLIDPDTGRNMQRPEFAKLCAQGGTLDSIDNNVRLGFAPDDPHRFFTLWAVTDKILWYLDRHGKLMAFGGRTRRYIGRLDEHGFNSALPSEPFLYYSAAGQQWIATAKTVYQVEIRERSLKPFFTLTNEEEVCGFNRVMIGPENRQTSYMFIATHKTLRLLDSEGRLIFAVPYQPGYMEYRQVLLFFLEPANGSAAHFALWFQPDVQLNAASGWKMPIHIVWLGPGDTVAKTADLPVLHPPDDISWQDKLSATPLPPWAYLLAYKNTYGPWIALSFVFAFLSAGIGWALTRRYNYSIAARIGWTLFIFVLGIAGLLALLCVQEWPAREACPHCGKLRAVDRETCEHCQSPFAPPEQNGTEIFAPLAKE